jgi:RTX calcium-binding nonapeptide repeat (4 copies)
MLGGSDADELYGGTGDDTMDGGTESDFCVGGGHVSGDAAVNCEQFRECRKEGWRH